VALVLQLFDHFGDRVADQVVKRLRAHEQDMISQAESPLGRRRHCAVVQRRVASGQPGAAVVGRKHLLSPTALSEELSRLGRSNKKLTGGDARSIADELTAAIAQTRPPRPDVSVDISNGSRRQSPSSKKSSNRNGAP
jgi:hypothetical protein